MAAPSTITSVADDVNYASVKDELRMDELDPRAQMELEIAKGLSRSGSASGHEQ